LLLFFKKEDSSFLFLMRIVLVTRPEPGAAETAARLRAMGFQPMITPCLAVAPRPARLPAAQRLAAILATSGQAVGHLSPDYHHLPLLGVGDATARRAAAAGFVRVHSAAGDAADLLRLAVRTIDPAAGALLLAVGARQSLTLAAELRAAGFRVLRRVVYEAAGTRRLPDAAIAALGCGEVRAALFFSAETARAFVGLLPDSLRTRLPSVDALAIGERAAAVLRVLPWRDVRVALRPTQDELLALL